MDKLEKWKLLLFFYSVKCVHKFCTCKRKTFPSKLRVRKDCDVLQ